MKSIRIPFRFEEGSVMETSNIDTIVKQEIINYFVTTPGERVMNAAYGGGINQLLYEINDPLVLSDYKVDAIPDVNSHLSFGRVLDFGFVNNEESLEYEPNVATMVIRYAVAPRTVSTVKLVVTSTFTEESEI